jgi:hypothetical protein
VENSGRVYRPRKPGAPLRRVDDRDLGGKRARHSWHLLGWRRHLCPLVDAPVASVTAAG